MDNRPTRTIGQSFILKLIVLLTLVIFVYLVSHLIVMHTKSDEQGAISWKYFAQLSSTGEVNFKNLGDLDWYIGAEQSLDTIAKIRDRSTSIFELFTKTKAQILQLKLRVNDLKEITPIETQLDQGEYNNAYLLVAEVSSKLSASNLLPNTIKENLFALDRLKQQQLNDLETLSPPNKLFMWTSPNLSMLEILFWAVFGVITNLLVNSAEYLRKQNFNPLERWVAYTKLIYGPILALVMVMAIMFGWFDLGPYKARVWTLPLIGFIFGYASRRTAALFDKLIAKVLGEAEKSINEGPKKLYEERTKLIRALKSAAEPKGFGEIKSQAKELANGLVESQLAKKDPSK
ncbi:hypothetical protein Q4574_19605 [Aliiglaciecola sp. 3_MG-2023]|uniref:hypothetical protein n=1 Tax=Aliiglaciecola sp. 3_MG-2023 TaxID=3062644 RepID=UPI0026E1DCE0|nr:hypothetical protein [Aliiglaciecola sp. 3_MG-2023]MDO6695515.1 hypothetical protein [Aliiglaciecola sp. 3_MG-2023]